MDTLRLWLRPRLCAGVRELAPDLPGRAARIQGRTFVPRVSMDPCLHRSLETSGGKRVLLGISPVAPPLLRGGHRRDLRHGSIPSSLTDSVESSRWRDRNHRATCRPRRDSYVGWWPQERKHSGQYCDRWCPGVAGDGVADGGHDVDA